MATFTRGRTEPAPPPRHRGVLRAAAFYFALVFATGFLLGTVRALWVVPRLGERWAELAELPLMTVASALGARATARRFELRRRTWRAWAVGWAALALLVGAEIGLTSMLRGQNVVEYAASRDPVSGGAYLAALVVFALLPALLAPRGAASGG